VPGGPLRPWLLGTQLGVILSFGYVRLSLGRTTERLAYAPIGACPRRAQDSQANRDGLFIIDPHELVSWVKQIQLLSRFHLTPITGRVAIHGMKTEETTNHTLPRKMDRYRRHWPFSPVG
jgi:hypothetical protein